MLKFKQRIVSLIKMALTEEGLTTSESSWTVRPPTNFTHGDLACNVALVLFAKNSQSQMKNSQFDKPRALAQQLVAQMKQLKAKSKVLSKYLEEISVAGPGFINFKLSEAFYTDKIPLWLEKPTQQVLQTKKGQKVIVEYTDPNPFKEFHIGHLYSNSVGETIARLNEAVGAKVHRANYFGDVGLHVAKSIWGLFTKLREEYPNLPPAVALAKLEERSLSDRIKFLGQSYARGATAYKQDQSARELIKQLNFQIYLAGQEYMVENEGWQPQIDYSEFIPKETHYAYQDVKLIYQAGKSWSLAYFEEIYQKLGTKFDGYYPESVMGEYGLKIVRQFLEKGVFEKSQGAVIFPGSKYGLHDRVFINSMDLPTYEAKELALSIYKNNKYPYDQSYIVTGNEIVEYFRVLLKAMSLIRPDLRAKTTHVAHGMVRLPEGKMSSRTGKILTGEWLINEAIKKIKAVLAQNRPELTEVERLDLAQPIAIAAIKYALLKSSLGNDIAFNFNESLSFQGNSGPYLLYTVVRCKGILQKASVSDQLPKNSSTKSLIDTLINLKSYSKHQIDQQERLLLNHLLQYSDTVVEAAENHAPHLVANFVYNLATAFNQFYTHHQVLPKREQLQEKEQQPIDPLLDPTISFRLLLTAAVLNILEAGLNTLGIPTVEKM